MAPGGSMLHLQELSNNSYPEPSLPNFSYFFKIHFVLRNKIFESTCWLTFWMTLVKLPYVSVIAPHYVTNQTYIIELMGNSLLCLVNDCQFGWHFIPLWSLVSSQTSRAIKAYNSIIVHVRSRIWNRISIINQKQLQKCCTKDFVMFELW